MVKWSVNYYCSENTEPHHDCKQKAMMHANSCWQAVVRESEERNVWHLVCG